VVRDDLYKDDEKGNEREEYWWSIGKYDEECKQINVWLHWFPLS
jgi:hypothetical protein